jgi:predicted DsbA family dithiol-disulfide isomerase
MPPIELGFISDYICPWCWLGYGRLRLALRGMEEAGALPAEGIIIRHWPFELNPNMPAEGMSRHAYRSAKFGSWENSQAHDAAVLAQAEADGVPFHFDAITRTPSTKAAHRLTLLVQQYHPAALEPFVEGVFRAYFVHGQDIGDLETLGSVLENCGLDRGVLLDRLRSGQATATMEATARRCHDAGVRGVPVFLLGGMRLDGAQPIDTLKRALSATLRKDRIGL